MTAAEAVETSVTNSLSQDYANLDDRPSPTCTDTPGFKPFTLLLLLLSLSLSLSVLLLLSSLLLILYFSKVDLYMITKNGTLPITTLISRIIAKYIDKYENYLLKQLHSTKFTNVARKSWT